MSSVFHGRVVATRPFDGGDEVTVVVEGRAHVVRRRSAEPALAPGDLVAVSQASADAFGQVTRVAGVQSGAWDPSGDALRWQSGPAPRMEALRARQTILRAVREYLHAEGFFEAHAPLLIRGTCPDLAIDSIRAEGGYLTSSTEYQIKRLIAGGFLRVFTLTQNFRRGEVSEVHNPEFTMLEWARAHASLEDIEADVEAFVAAAVSALGISPAVVFGEERVVMAGIPWRRLTVRDALAQHLGVEVDESFALVELQRAVARSSLDVPERFRENAFDLVSYLLVLLQPHLGNDVPVFLRDWPAFMTSSAGLVPGKPQLADRSELFVAGLEIADGFPFLTDAALQARLFAAAQEERRVEGKEAVDVDLRYVEALRLGMPPGAGMALGFDRLVMVLTGRTHIRDVLTFAWDER